MACEVSIEHLTDTARQLVDAGGTWSEAIAAMINAAADDITRER